MSRKGIDIEIAKILKEWWEVSLTDEMRDVITPRRIEYIGMMITKNIPWRDCFPQGNVIIPVDDLVRKIRILNGEEQDIIISRDTIITNKQTLLERIKDNPKYAIPISAHMQKFTEDEIFECRDLLEAMPKELVIKVGNCKFNQRKRLVKQLFTQSGVNIEKYPKIKEAFEPKINE